jgi:hypothetical protein
MKKIQKPNTLGIKAFSPIFKIFQLKSEIEIREDLLIKILF